ncbi:MAG: UvrB/UvrC motif-containing protein [Planctomycetales bacterium]|nr:UvrB/UvrC motif-containing protein [Planctomycetales bacterium]
MDIVDEPDDRDEHLDDYLDAWPYDPTSPNVRMVFGSDGRELLQMRIELGILQLETEGRPDGNRPEGFVTYADYLSYLAKEEPEFEMDEDQCNECDREFVQFYHRRMCWLALEDYEHAVQDADHTLWLMDLCREHSPDEDWTMSHEQYRPYVMYQRIQATAMADILGGKPDVAVQSINAGLDQLRGVFVEFEIEDRFEEDQLVRRLVDLRETLRDQFSVGRTLQEQLSDAIAAEQYEVAAQLRDELAKRDRGRR